PLEQVRPAVFRCSEHCGNELTGLIGGGTGLARTGRRGLGRLVAARQDLGAADEQARVDPERPPDQSEHTDGTDAEPAAPTRDAEPALSGLLAAIIDIVAAAKIVPSHRLLLSGRRAPACRTRPDIVARRRCAAAKPAAARPILRSPWKVA